MSYHISNRPPVGSYSQPPGTTPARSSLVQYSTSNAHVYGTSFSHMGTYRDAYMCLSQSYVKPRGSEELHSSSVRQVDREMPSNTLRTACGGECSSKERSGGLATHAASDGTQGDKDSGDTGNLRLPAGLTTSYDNSAMTQCSRRAVQK